MTDDRRLVDRLFWARHANPGSVWTLIATFPVLVAGLYRRDRRLLAATLLFVAVNPLVFPPPADDRAWATRVVHGERVWLERGLGSSPADVAVLALGAPVVLYTLRAALAGRPLRTALGTLLSLGAMLLFFERMARLYERFGRDAGTA
jgi:hypothetical protein